MIFAFDSDCGGAPGRLTYNFSWPQKTQETQ